MISQKKFIFSAVLACLFFGFWVASAFFSLPDPKALATYYPDIIHKKNSEEFLIKMTHSPPSHWVRLQNISEAAVRAILLSEDWAFFQHAGVDFKQVQEVLEESLKEKKLTRGASTITQQVARNVFLSQERTLTRKMKEIILAFRMEEVLSKKKILEVYLNIAEWGPGIYGIKRASSYYFQKHPSELTPKEGAFLAMLLPSPIRYSQSFKDRKLTPFASRSIETVLKKMEQTRFITPEKLEAELQTPLDFENTPNQNSIDAEPPASELPLEETPEEQYIAPQSGDEPNDIQQQTDEQPESNST